ncbi:uncharacterized protein LOC127729682 isoform X2 [Mytilus californianus]|uniref:uncharacterized protein LOC127729682 isoform X2 n=1 Tax=Mytilus californianus TaxID=6549 RepID=UPI0022458D3B|nr:uncharacterized protein LOC127729682 isoform X2 [Mytilus californianus]
MENSPGRELRNRVRQSPSSSPAAASQRIRSPHSSPSQPGSSLLNGAFRLKTATTNRSDVEAGGQSNPTVINVENGSFGKHSLGTSAHNLQENQSSFHSNNIFIDSLTMDSISKTGTVQTSSLDINSNMSLFSTVSVASSYVGTSVSGLSGRRSRKQSSPKRARTASNSPVQMKSFQPPLWDEKLESTPKNARKRPRKICYVAIDDSPASSLIDLTNDCSSSEKCPVSTPLGYSPLGCSPKLSVKKGRAGNQINKASPSRAMKTSISDGSQPSQCLSPKASKLIDKSSSPKAVWKPLNVEVFKDCNRIVTCSPKAERSSPRSGRKIDSIRSRPSPLRNSPRTIGKNSPKMSMSQAVSNNKRKRRQMENLEGPKAKRSRIISAASLESRIVNSPRRNLVRAAKESPKNYKDYSPKNLKSDHESSPKKSPQHLKSNANESERKISPVCRKLNNESPVQCKTGVKKTSTEVSENENVKTSQMVKKIEKQGSEAEGNSSPQKTQVGKSESEILKKSTNSVSKGPTAPNVDLQKSTEICSAKNNSPFKLQAESPVKVKVEPATPSSETNDPSTSKFNFDEQLLQPNSAKLQEEKANRRIVRPRKTVGRQRKSSGGNRGRPSTGKRKKVMLSPCKFQINQEVLARWYDGLFYLGTVCKVDERGRKCYVRFEDDSEYWILFKDLQKGANEGDVSCCLCQTDVSDKPNEIVLCDNCGLGYHQECHNPNISTEVLQPDVEWCCRLCVFAAAVKKGGALKNGPDAKALQKMKQTFPYDINKLTWDAQHKTNVEQCYCYCGGPGSWFLKMLQCCRCRQWFHEACIQCLEYPLMNGDRFYLFVCSHCNMGPEYIKRLDLKWVDVVHLTLYNLTIEGRWNKFFDVDTIVDFITSNLENLQVNSLSADKDSIREKVVNSLNGYKSRFTNQKENRKKPMGKPCFGLRVRIPPPAPMVMLPHTGQVNHEVMMSYKEKGKNFKCFMPSQCTSPVCLPWQSKQKGLEIDVSIAFKSDKVRRNLLQNASGNQEYKGYDSENSVPTDMVVNQHSLEALIPPPKNFEGFNHPFKHFFEQEEELAHHKRKNEIINYLFMEYESDIVSQSSVESAVSSVKDDPTKAIPTPPPSITSGNSKVEIKNIIKSRGRKRKAADTPTEPMRQSKRKRVTTSYFNVLDVQTIESVKSKPVNMAQIRNNMCQYFGAADRLRKGEKYNVFGKHVTNDGKTKYLIQWEGLQTK